VRKILNKCLSSEVEELEDGKILGKGGVLLYNYIEMFPAVKFINYNPSSPDRNGYPAACGGRSAASTERRAPGV